MEGVCQGGGAECRSRLPYFPLLEGPGQDLPKREGWPPPPSSFLQVLLNDRDPVRWFESVNNTIYNTVAFSNSPLVKFNPALRLWGLLAGFTGVPSALRSLVQRPLAAARTALCYAETPLGNAFPRGLFGAMEGGEELATRSLALATSIPRFFREWKEQVVREVPEDRLLIWQVRQGWRPLCQVPEPPLANTQFLGLPEPDQPFPNVNDTPTQLTKFRWAIAASVGSCPRHPRTQKLYVAFTWALNIAAAAAALHYFAQGNLRA